MLTTGARASIPSRVRQESRLPSTSIGVVPASTTFTREACAPRSATRNSRAASELAMKSGVRATAKAVRRRPNFLGRMTSCWFQTHVDAPVARQIRPQRMFGRDVYGRSASGRRVQSRATRAPSCRAFAIWLPCQFVGCECQGIPAAVNSRRVRPSSSVNARTETSAPWPHRYRASAYAPRSAPPSIDHASTTTIFLPARLVLSLSGPPISAYRPTSAASRRRTRGKRRDSRSVILRSSSEIRSRNGSKSTSRTAAHSPA